MATDFERQWGIPAERVPLTGSTNADRAVLARIGGNIYRRAFQPPGEGYAWKAGPRLDGYVHDDAESLMAGRSYLRGGYSQVYTSDTYHSPATFHGLTHHMSPRDYSATLPESAFDWPVYRAATTVRPVDAAERDDAVRVALAHANNYAAYPSAAVGAFLGRLREDGYTVARDA